MSEGAVQNRLGKLQGQAAKLPVAPGVYIMRDARRQIIYVGKAINLRARVRQYFADSDTRYQVSFLMQRLADLDFIVTHTEAEALLLENSLIKKHRPRYNVFLKDDKTYLALRLGIKDEFPRLTATRRIRKDGALYFGPFTHAESLREVKEFIDQYFMLRSCNDHELNNRTRPCLEYQIKRCSAPCVGLVNGTDYGAQINNVRMFLEGKSDELQRHVERQMQIASESENFEEAARLRDLLKSMAQVLEKQRVTALSFDFLDVIDFLRQDERVGIAVLMIREGRLIESKYVVVKSLEDDQAFLSHFLMQYYGEKSFTPSQIVLPISIPDAAVISELLTEHCNRKIAVRVARAGEHRDLVKMARENLKSRFGRELAGEAQIQGVLESLKKKLELTKKPQRIECCDISNISGAHAVGSLIVFEQGVAAPRQYRRFKIRGKSTPDDYAMMKEMLSRRFLKKDSQGPYPDLLIVDGGRGQLGIALNIFSELKVTGIDVVGVAKGRGPGARAMGEWAGKKCEEVYLPRRKNPVILRPGSPESWMLQRVRDEAHRFAITYHRQLRAKALTTSWLDQISGVGAMRKKQLLKKFGSVEAVRRANLVDLKKMGISEAVARRILEG